jgi:hypothetical protein
MVVVVAVAVVVVEVLVRVMLVEEEGVVVDDLHSWLLPAVLFGI